MSIRLCHSRMMFVRAYRGDLPIVDATSLGVPSIYLDPRRAEQKAGADQQGRLRSARRLFARRGDAHSSVVERQA